jgi:YVTN family beta-propeller protein
MILTLETTSKASDGYSKMQLRMLAWKFMDIVVPIAALIAMSASSSAQQPSTSLLNATRAIAIDTSTRKAYAVSESQDAVLVYDPEKKTTASMKVGKWPVALAINEVTHRIYVANNGSGSVSVIDGVHDTVLATVDVGALPYVLAVNPATNKIFVSNTFTDVITLIDGATNATSSIKAGSADSIVIDAQRDRAYLVGWESTNLTVLDSKPFLVAKIPLNGMHVWGTLVDQTTGKVFATKAGSAELLIVDKDSGTIRAVPTGEIPCAIAQNPTTGFVYVVNHGDATVTALGGANLQPVAIIKVGKSPQGIAINAKSNRIYVANVHGDSVTLIDGGRNVAVKTFRVGKNPYALAVDENSGRLYVALEGEPSFATIDPASPAD